MGKRILGNICYGRILKYFLLFFFINITLFAGLLFLENKMTLNSQMQLLWNDAYIRDDQETLKDYLKNYNTHIENKKTKCKKLGFYRENEELHFCKDKQLVIFKGKKEKEDVLMGIVNNMPYILLITVILVIYLQVSQPYFYFKVSTYYEDDIIPKIQRKIFVLDEVTELDLLNLENYLLQNIIRDDKNTKFFGFRKTLFEFYNQSLNTGMKELSSRIKIITKKIEKEHYIQTKKNWKVLGNRIAEFSSQYLTSLSTYMLFLAIFVLYNALAFKAIFYYITGGMFDKDFFWYVYETINITSNLGGNTDTDNIIGQIFLSYLTISGVAIFGVFMAIINEKVKLD